MAIEQRVPKTHWPRLPNGDVAGIDWKIYGSTRLDPLIDELFHWIARDDGTGFYGNYIDQALKDLIDEVAG